MERTIQRYEWGYHGSDDQYAHVAAIWSDGEREDLFDVTLYGNPGSDEFDADKAESLEALKTLLDAANLLRVERGLFIEALDSHEYWQLSEEEHRDSGFVMDEGVTPEIEHCRVIVEKLESFS